jgi:Zinc dependent phospholipase C
MRRFRVGVLVLLVCAGLPAPADAWGFEAHKFIMARAIALLPREIRPYFEKYKAAIVEHAIDPDLWRTAGWLEEPPRHFVDMDAYGPYPFTEMPHRYDEAVKRHGTEFVLKNGTLPWRSEEIYTKLVEAFTQKAGYSRENIRFFSSVLTHYASDAHVPFHAALNYDGQLTGQWGIHSRFEGELFERYRSRLRISPRPTAPIPNPREFIFATLTASFPLVQPVLDADKKAITGRDAYDSTYFTLFFSSVGPILEQRLSDSITGAASLITAAWVEAGRPALPLEAPRTPRKVRRPQ